MRDGVRSRERERERLTGARRQTQNKNDGNILQCFEKLSQKKEKKKKVVVWEIHFLPNPDCLGP